MIYYVNIYSPKPKIKKKRSSTKAENKTKQNIIKLCLDWIEWRIERKLSLNKKWNELHYYLPIKWEMKKKLDKCKLKLKAILNIALSYNIFI